MPVWSRIVASVGSAGLLWASFSPGLGWVVWVALVPFLWALDGVRMGRGAGLGVVFGVVFFALEFSTLLSLRPFVGWMVVPICAALALYGGFFLALFGAVAARWASPAVWAGGWVLIEALRATGPLGFTFGSVPGAVAETLFVSAAAMGGPWLLSLGVAWTAGCLARGLRRPRWLRWAILGPLVLAGLTVAPTGTHITGQLAVALIQPNIAKVDQLDERLLPRHVDVYREILEGVVPPVDLVVLPENALPWVGETAEYLDMFKDAARRLGATVLVGTADFRDGDVHNTVLVLGPLGDQQGSYAKTRLVPFGEQVPWRGFWEQIGLGALIDSFLPWDQTPGEAVLPVGSLGILICFESTFPDITRELARQGAEVLIAPTSDGWFGRTRILWEHYVLGALRAAETGRSLVQVGQTGISGGWDFRGREVVRQPPWEEGVVHIDVPLRAGLTPYARWGDGPVLATAGLLALIAALAQRPRRGRGRARSVAG